MRKTTTFLALALLLPLGVAQAGDLDDLTMQVMESNDPSERINDIELPDLHSTMRHDRDHRDEASHSVDDRRGEIESEADDRSEVEDSVDDSRDEAEDHVDDSHDDAREEAEEGAGDAQS